MQSKKLKLSIALLVLGLGSVFAQRSIVNAGGNATGSGGSASYSVGQIVYETNTSATGSVAQGAQQPFEIQTVLGTENFNINLLMTVYPNPTVNFLSLEINNYNLDSISYQLFDLNGRIIKDNKVSNSTTTIEMEKYPMAVYLLKILENNKEIKTFKIIKN